MSENAARKAPPFTVLPGNRGSGSVHEERSDSEQGKPANLNMKYLVRALVKYNASDLHIKPGRPPLYRINGRLIPAKMPQLSLGQVETIIFGILQEQQMKDLKEKRQIDFSFQISGFGRFRCNIFFQREMVAAVVRMIPLAIPSFEELGLPVVLKELSARPRGLFLLTGATGSGKSTTLGAVIQQINQTRHAHILMLEDPIEFVYRDEKASITQREVGSDTNSFQEGLYAGLRQDPDVIVIGELRDPEIIRIALTAAETGHLVIGTMHTKSVKSTVERLLDVFPAEQQNQVRIELASSLIGVMTQQLVIRANGVGRVAACEVMVKSPAIENLIARNEIEKISEQISTSSTYYKMQTLNQDLERLVRQGTIRMEDAMKTSDNPDDIKLKLDGIRGDVGFDVNGIDRSNYTGGEPPAPPTPPKKGEIQRF